MRPTPRLPRSRTWLNGSSFSVQAATRPISSILWTPSIPCARAGTLSACSTISACLDSTVYGRHVVGKLKDAASFSADTWFINAIGSEVSFAKREEIIAATRLADKRFATLVHPGAAVSRGAVMGAGAYACFGVSVGNGVRVGRHVHIGVGAVLGHDASVGDFTLIAPRAVLSGCVRIAKSAYIGAGSSVKQKVP